MATMAHALLRSVLLWNLVLLCVVTAFDSQSSSSLRPRPPSSSSQLSSSSTTTTGHGAEERRKQSLEQGHHPLFSLNLNLDALAQSGAAPRAQELLQRINALYQEGYYEVAPDIVSYNSVLKAWKIDENPTQAFELLQEILQNEEEDDTVKANVISFNTVILAFAKRGNYPQAQQLLRQMQQQERFPQPDTMTFNAVLYAFAQSKDPGAAVQAENLLKEMMQSNVTVDTISFNTVLHAWAQVANKEAISGAHRAQDLLQHMEQLAAAGNDNVHPDVYSYTTVIQAWAMCEKAIRAQEVLNQMISRGLTPNRFTYTAVMSSLAKGGEAEKAQVILNDMMFEYAHGNEDMKPDTVAFSCVMDGFAKMSSVDKPQAADKAMLLLQRMKALEGDGMGPNALTYTSALTALAKSGTWEACERARSLVRDMQLEYERGKKHMQPSTIHYNTVLNAYARSPRADKALKAAGLMLEMQQHPNPRCRPDVISYNSLLMACANAFGNEELKTKSFFIALEAFKATMVNDHGIRPTSTTFAHFLKAERRLLNPTQQKSALRKTFKLCCEKGLVNSVVIQHVQRACGTEAEWNEMVGEGSQFMALKERIQISSFPQAWTRNARR
jgi:pentatricopeptide repeat protein